MGRVLLQHHMTRSFRFSQMLLERWWHSYNRKFYSHLFGALMDVIITHCWCELGSFSFWTDSLEDDACLNISTLNRTRAASVSLSASCFTRTTLLHSVPATWAFAKLRKYYAIDHTASYRLLSHHWIPQTRLAMRWWCKVFFNMKAYFKMTWIDGSSCSYLSYI